LRGRRPLVTGRRNNGLIDTEGTAKGVEHRAWGIGIADFELRNREPARRVGVRRTISDLRKKGGQSLTINYLHDEINN
jgi:hypothetical protein